MASTYLTALKEARASGLTGLEATQSARASVNSSTSTSTPSTTVAPQTTPNTSSGSNLTSQLGLGLASSQTNSQNNQVGGSGGNFSTTTDSDGNVTISGGINIPAETNVILGGGDAVSGFSSPTNTTTNTSTANKSTTPTNNISTNTPTNTNSNNFVSDVGSSTTGKNTNKNTTTSQVANDATNLYNDSTDLITSNAKDASTTNQEVYDENKARIEMELLQKQSDATTEAQYNTQRATEDARIQQEYDTTYRTSQEASLAKLKATQELAEREASIANDVAIQSANVNMQKLGLTLSTAGITQAQQIFTTGAYKLASLKADNAYKYADLQEQVAKTQFTHQTEINKIIRGAEDKNLTLRKDLNKDISALKASLTTNKADKQKRTDEIIKSYVDMRAKNEQDFLKSLTSISESQIKQTEALYGQLKAKEGYANDKITQYVTSGRWEYLPENEKVRLEREAGVVPGTTMKKIEAEMSTQFPKQWEELTGLKGSSFDLNTYQEIMKKASYWKSQGKGIENSLQLAISEFMKKSPNFIAEQKKLAKAGSSGGGSGKGTSYGTSALATVTDKDGNTKTVNYIPGKGGTPGMIESDGKVLPMSDFQKVTIQTNPLNKEEDVGIVFPGQPEQ